MKRSELKSYIKEQILSTLGEDDRGDAIEELGMLLQDLEAKSDEARQLVKAIDPNEISRLDAYDAFNFGFSSNPNDTTLAAFYSDLTGEDGEMFEAGDGKVDTFQVDKTDRAAVDAAKKAADDDDIIQIGEQDDEETDKAAAKGAKKAVGKSKRLDAKIKALKTIEADMKSILNKYKKAEGEEKDKFKDQLKSKTALKKETEKEIERLEREMV